MDKPKYGKVKTYIARNAKSITRLIRYFLFFFVLNFILFTIDLYGDTSTFFFHRPLIISGLIMVVLVFKELHLLQAFKNKWLKKKEAKPSSKQGKKEESEEGEEGEEGKWTK